MAELSSLESAFQNQRHYLHEAQPLQCCCGNADCTFLRHGAETVEALERDVKAAASVGQALLIRHEAYIADAEEERVRNATKILDFERKNAAMEEENARVVAENRELLNQVEDLNQCISESDGHIRTLTATLYSTQRETQRLASLASRTADLERQLLDYEAQQARLHVALQRNEENERVAVNQRLTLERQLKGLQYQLEQIEADADEERQRYNEVIARMKRRSTVEQELDSPRENNRSRNEKNEVVSSFVREILLDNANLQLSVVELQDQLQMSHQDLNNLRAELTDSQEQNLSLTRVHTPLDKELSHGQARQISQELHVHHHYHAPPVSSQNRVKTKKKRPALMPARTCPTPTHGESQEDAPSDAMQASNTRYNVIHRRNRWSAQSSKSKASVISSGMSSPQSVIFDRPFEDESTDISRPTSPESIGAVSPFRDAIRRQNPLDGLLFQPHSLPNNARSNVFAKHASSNSNDSLQDDIIENGLANTYKHINETELSQIFEEEDEAKRHIPDKRTGLRRTNSQTSLFSISGMDIHSTFPSTRCYDRPSALRNKSSFTQANTKLAFTAAVALANREPKGGAHSALHKTLGRSTYPRGDPESLSSEYTPLLDTFGRKFGGWLSNRLVGGSASQSQGTVNQEPDPTQNLPGRPRGSARTVSSPADAPNMTRPLIRTPDEGLDTDIISTPEPQSVEVTAALDQEALQECLREDHRDLL